MISQINNTSGKNKRSNYKLGYTGSMYDDEDQVDMFDQPKNPKKAGNANHLLGFFEEEKKPIAPKQRGPHTGYSKMAKRQNYNFNKEQFV